MSERPARGSRRSEAGGTPERLLQALRVAGASVELRKNDHLRLLEAIVATAVRVIDATGGSLMLLEPETNELVFQVAVGPGADEIKHFRVPVGQGVAGFTASTGQALAIADTSRDTRFARQIAEGSGYVPKNLLCVPLMLNGAVIGVMELLDKNGGAAPFSPSDTAVLSSFGDQAAMAIDLSLQAQSLRRLLAAAAGADGDASLNAEVERVAGAAVSGGEQARTLALAARVAEIAGRGEREAQLCADVLEAVARYARGGSVAADKLSFGIF